VNFSAYLLVRAEKNHAQRGRSRMHTDATSVSTMDATSDLLLLFQCFVEISSGYWKRKGSSNQKTLKERSALMK
jgi:hypothetical protein